ncbi:MAG: DUF1905 domain-containing protein [Chloroflexi bacterium]|nr:MAG: DUF1905 domain-containing protein [Chloroflexota bacterium]
MRGLKDWRAVNARHSEGGEIAGAGGRVVKRKLFRELKPVSGSDLHPKASHKRPTLAFAATLYTIDKSTILRLPEKASAKLPSRGQVAVQGTINGHPFQTVLEPDGNSGHWMRIDGRLRQTAALSAGAVAALEIEPLKDWPEPKVPQDLETALAAAPQKIQNLWKDITPMARWEWVRWVSATRDPDTRNRRVEVSVSKMKSGKRRPCCFNLAACTAPDLSKNGRLIE